MVIGPVPWCPEDPCEEHILASVSTRRDISKGEASAGTLPVGRLVLGDNNVALRRMEVNRPEDDRDCDGKGKTVVYRYAVKFVCGCSKGS